MSTDEQQGQTPLLRAGLLVMIDDQAIFESGEDDENYHQEAAAHRDQYRTTMTGLYEQAACCWSHSFTDDMSDHPTPDLFGPALNCHCSVLASCWLADFRAAVRKAAETATAGDRDFLYFMLGTLELGWQTSSNSQS